MNAEVLAEEDDHVGYDAGSGTWIVEERGRYRVVAPGADRATFGGAALERDARGFVLPLSFWTGRAAVELRFGDTPGTVPLMVQPSPHKLPPEEWETLLDEIDRRWPGCTLGVEGGLHGRAGDAGLERLLALLAFEPLLPEVLHDVAALLDALRTREAFPARMVPLRSVRKLDLPAVRWIATHPQVAAALHGRARASARLDDASVHHRIREVSWDHPANRAIRWLLERLALQLALLAGLLRARAEKTHGSLTDARAWCDERAQRLEGAAESIDDLVRQSPLARVAPAPPDEGALLTLANDPLYARVYRRCRKWLAPRFERPRPDGNRGPVPAGDVPIRASFELYERWCLLAVRRALADAFPDMQWTDSDTTATDAFAASGGVAAVGRSDLGTVTLHDNLTFDAWTGRQDRFSISTERRPDFAVTWEGRDGVRRWVALDAKYRATYGSIRHALEDLHVYRDALRWTSFSGACHAALLLVPRAEENAKRWGKPAFVEGFRFGFVELRPGGSRETFAALLRRWLTEPSSTREGSAGSSALGFL